MTIETMTNETCTIGGKIYPIPGFTSPGVMGIVRTLVPTADTIALAAARTAREGRTIRYDPSYESKSRTSWRGNCRVHIFFFRRRSLQNSPVRRRRLRGRGNWRGKSTPKMAVEYTTPRRELTTPMRPRTPGSISTTAYARVWRRHNTACPYSPARRSRPLIGPLRYSRAG